VRIESLVERVRINLSYMATFYYQQISMIAVWWLWNIPFQLFEILFSLLLFKLLTQALGASAATLYGGDFMAFLISGLMVNTYLDCSLDVYRDAVGSLYLGRMGVGGLLLSMADYLRLAGVSPLVYIFAIASWYYLMHTVMFALYYIIGVTFFGFQISPHTDLGLVALTLVLGILATSGLGLVSASMYWLASSYRGVEPIRWLIRVMAPVVAGIYVPRDALPRELAMLGNLLPHTYTIDAVRKLLLAGAGLNDIIGDLRVLAMQLILIPVGLLLLKYSLELERRRATIY